MTQEVKPLGINKIGIVGLGLIGGSLAKAIHTRTDIKEIVAVDKDEPSLKMAEDEGVITASSVNDLSILCTVKRVKFKIIHSLRSGRRDQEYAG